MGADSGRQLDTAVGFGSSSRDPHEPKSPMGLEPSVIVRI